MPGFPEISHNAGQMREHFLYIYFLLKLSGAAGGEAAAALMKHVRNSHASRAAAQFTEDGTLFQEYRYMDNT